MGTKNNQISLSASYDICAAHQLRRSDWSEKKNRAVFGHCADLHGHQYKVEIILSGEINLDTGMLINGYNVDHIFRKKILEKIDHKYLNKDVPFFKKNLPTAEWIAAWVFGELKKAFPVGILLKRVRVYETPNLYAEFCG